MAPTYPVFTQNNNKVLNDLKKLDGFGAELEALIGAGSADDGISAADVANYLKQLGVKTGQHDVALADRVSKQALENSGLLSVINNITGNDSQDLEETDLAAYLGRTTKVQNDHTYFLDNSAVSKEKFRSLTSAFTEFKKVEFSLPVTPAPNPIIFTPPAVNTGYIQVRDKDSITVNALVSMFNRGIINGSWDVEFINAPDDNGFVRNVDNMLTGVDRLISSSATRHLMCVKPEASFEIKMSFMVKDAADFSDFFMYSIIPNSGETGRAFNAKVLDLNSVAGTNPYISKGIDAVESEDRLENLHSSLQPNVFYDIKIVKTENIITFTISTEDGTYIGSGSDTVTAAEIKWGLLNNKNVSVRGVVMDGVTWFIGNGQDLTGEFGAYKIQSAINNNDFVVTYYISAGSFFEVINIEGPVIQSKLKTQFGSSADIQTSEDLDFIHAISDVEQHLIFDINGLRNRTDGLLFAPDEYDLTGEIDNIEKINETDEHRVNSLGYYQKDNGNYVILVQGCTEVKDVNSVLQGINAVFSIKLEIDATTKNLVSNTVTRTGVTLPAPYAFGDDRLCRILQQSPRNDPSENLQSELITKDSFFHIITGAKDVPAFTAEGTQYYKAETHVFILKDGVLIGTIPVKDKLGAKPLDRSYYKGPPPTDDAQRDAEVINYNEVILLGSQISIVDSADTSPYLYLCYAADTKGAPFSPPYSEVVRSATYQKLCRIDLAAVISQHQASGNPVELNIGDSTISYFSEDPSLVKEPKDYISPISSYPYGQHLNITSKAMVNVNRQNYFMRRMSIYELDLDNLYFKSRVDYESSINEDRRPDADWNNILLPFRVAVSKNYVNVIAGGNPLYSVSLESSFSKGRSAQLTDHLPPIEYLPDMNDADFILTDTRVSTLDPLPVPFLYSYDNLLPVADANTNLNNAKTISVNLNGTLTVDSETYIYDYATQRYTSETNPDNHYTVSDETGNAFDWNPDILLDGFPVVLASANLGGQKWLAFKTLDPQWVPQKYALDTSLTDVLTNYWPDYSHEEDFVPGYPNLVYMGLGIALKHANFWGPEILGETQNGWTYGYGVVEISKLDPPPS